MSLNVPLEPPALNARNVFAVVLNNVETPIYVAAEGGGAIIFANRAFESVFGQDWSGRTAQSLVSPHEAQDVRVNRMEDSEEWQLDKTGQCFSVHRCPVLWPDGRQVFLYQAQDITDWKRQEEDSNERAYTDYLTGLPNRRACDDELARTVERLRRVRTPGYLFFIDLDDFKIVNDSFGHDYGDWVLMDFADFLRQRFKGRDRIFRLGGDEFVVMVDPANGLMVPEYLDELLERARRPWQARDKEFYCSLSIGVVEYIASLETAGSILKKADIAMYHAKKTGKNNYAYFTEGLDSATKDRSEIESLLRQAIQSDYAGFEILYQPYFAVQPPQKSGGGGRGLRHYAPAGAEALLRLRGRDGKLIPPRDFISLSEYLGLIVPIGDYVLGHAADLCRRINESLDYDFSISVNLSAAQFKQKNVVQNMESLLKARGVKLGNMIIGVNEGVALSEKKNVMDHCAELRECGFKVVMDDFGSGNASFINMRDLPVDAINVASPYLRAYTDEFARHFIKMAVKLGHYSGKSVYLSGVETTAQLKFCRQIHADMVQGFLFNMPDSERKLLEQIRGGVAPDGV